ncbi:hypothetical protein [Streptomyces subrutilus]|uniref:Extensin n=1 Tax=Streptomyces subrutilus TaxID=36818 RepID=A0A1E5PUZ3_9ACTN|nr:hypothetical protein [Streptomyces subrutilus]OEJ33406.1 hypothetical protein BGK67_20580 [Streptomyces subrutilus]
MADERDRWLDEAAADRLLRGEPVEPVGPAADPRARREAARLRAALDSLTPPAPTAGELPGEDAAVAAFRAAHSAGAPATAVPASPVSAAAGPSSAERCAATAAAGPARSGEPLVALGHAAGLHVPGPRRSRAVRFGLAAALASVAVGGLAAAAAAGLLDRPVRDTAGPGPAVSVSADGDPAQGDGSGGSTLDPQLRPTPLRDGAGPTASAGTPHPPGTEGFTESGGDTRGEGSSGTSAVGGTGTGPGPDGKDDKDGRDDDGTFRTDGLPDGSGGETTSRDRDRDRENQRRAVDLCHDYRAGHLNDDRRERLSRLAKGLSRIPYYCEALLDGVVHDDGRTNSPSAPADSGAIGRMLRDPSPVTSRL